LYDFKSTAVNNFDSFFYFYFFRVFDTKSRKNARLLMKAEFFRSWTEYKKRAARVLL